MTHHSIKISVEEEFQDLLIAQLLNLGITSFLQDDNILEAYLEEGDVLLENEVIGFLAKNNFDYSIETHNSKDWNAVWESSFEPIEIKGVLRVRADFHKKDNDYSYDLIINPKMAFGTGHHETTSMILEWMTNIDFENKNLLDFGCGTGILGIFGLLKSAASCCFIDNDPSCIENTLENLKVNGVANQCVILGTKTQIPSLKFDFVFANITRNVLLESLFDLANVLNPGGTLILSGLLVEDVQAMRDKINECGLQLISRIQKNSWACMITEKQ